MDTPPANPSSPDPSSPDPNSSDSTSSDPTSSDSGSPDLTSPDPPSPVPTSPVSLRELEDQITELAGHLNAAQYRWLTLIAEFDRRQGWSDGLLHSCAHWLNFKCGLNLGAAREKVRVAHALAGLPKIAASMARGELSYSKVRALTRVACAVTEDALLMTALHGTAHHVETLVRGFRRAQQAEELSREAQQHASRSVSYWFAEDGSLILHGRLPAVSGAMLIKALEAALEMVPKKEATADKEEERTVSFTARRADALGVVAESFLAKRAAKSTAADRYQVVVHVDAATLKEHTAGRCEIEHGPSLPAETVRRLSCDASLLTVLEDEHGAPLDVGRKTRSIPAAIRRALQVRDTGCRFPGCTHARYLDAHHIEHWADGGETKLSNLISLCRLHHRLVHEGDIRIETGPDGRWRFVRADGRYFDMVRVPKASYQWDDLQHTHQEQGIRIDRRTAATRWGGERMDYELGVWVLCRQVEHARNLARSGSDGEAATYGETSEAEGHGWDSDSASHGVNGEAASHQWASEAEGHGWDSDSAGHGVNGEAASHQWESEAEGHGWDSDSAGHGVNGEAASHQWESESEGHGWDVSAETHDHAAPRDDEATREHEATGSPEEPPPDAHAPAWSSLPGQSLDDVDSNSVIYCLKDYVRRMTAAKARLRDSGNE